MLLQGGFEREMEDGVRSFLCSHFQISLKVLFFFFWAGGWYHAARAGWNFDSIFSMSFCIVLLLRLLPLISLMRAYPYTSIKQQRELRFQHLLKPKLYILAIATAAFLATNFTKALNDSLWQLFLYGINSV